MQSLTLITFIVSKKKEEEEKSKIRVLATLDNHPNTDKYTDTFSMGVKNVAIINTSLTFSKAQSVSHTK